MKKQAVFVRIGLLFSLTLSMLGTVRPAHAASLSVCLLYRGCDYDSITAAVAAASDGDTITVGAGTYAEHDITVGKNITINGAGSGVVAVNGNNLGRIFMINSGVTATISGMTIENGHVSAGGGIYNLGTLTMTNIILWANSGNSGGGIVNAGTLTITQSTLSGNTSTGNSGGGIFNDGTLNVTQTTFDSNIATTFRGGGIFNEGDVTISNSTFAGNSAHDGGGIYNTNTLSIINSGLIANGAVGNGGGIYNAGTLSLASSTLVSNTADYGGGIDNAGTLSLTNTTFSTNSAGEGGGVYTNSSPILYIINSTFSGNLSTIGGGGGIYHLLTPVVLDNTILANSTGGNCGGTSGAIDNAGHNLEDGTTCGWGTASGSMSSTNPLLDALANNGGPTSTMALLPGSPAIDAGNDGTCSHVDQRGVARPQGAHCDIGAFEAQTYSLAITSANGTVAKSPDKTSFHEGDVVQLTATPAAGWAFDYWSGALTGSANPGSVTIHGYTSVTANYSILSNLTLTSVAAQDGWVLESSENSNKGGSINSSAPTFNLGDDAAKRQYRAILSFSTGTKLPATAVITGATLKVKKQAILGGSSQLAIFKGFMVDIKNGFFGTAALKAGDFQAAAGQSLGPFKPALASGGWYSIDLSGAIASINHSTAGSGLTQMRLRFKLDDNNNAVANILSLYSGNTPIVANRPQLVITYYVP